MPPPIHPDVLRAVCKALGYAASDVLSIHATPDEVAVEIADKPDGGRIIYHHRVRAPRRG
jgi:hypothetical protein